MKKYFYSFQKYFLAFIVLIISYTTLLTLVYTIPNKAIDENVQQSLALIENEGEYPLVQFGGTVAARLDNFTDRVMLQGTLKKDAYSVLEASQNIREYPRYWHGYQVILRPLLIGFNYLQIRYLNVFLILGLLCLVFSNIKKKVGISYSLVFLISMAMIYVSIIPLSMQFSTAYVAALVAMLFIGGYKDPVNHFRIGMLFFITGSVVNYIDFLTYPLITLFLPLVYALLISSNSEKSTEFLQSLLFIVKNSILWGIAYASTWISKWVISSLVLKQNIINQAMKQAAFRTAGDERFETSHWKAITNNFNLMFPGFVLKLIVFIVIIWLVAFIFYRKPWRRILSCIPLVFISITPYVWYLVLANHSQMHYWFTYRLQSITVFSLGCFLLFCLDFKKVKLRSFTNNKRNK